MRDFLYEIRKPPSGNHRYALRSAIQSRLCAKGLHWPITWGEHAYPGSWDPPAPPEPGFACEWCGEVRDPYRAWWWAVKDRYHMWRGRL